MGTPTASSGVFVALTGVQATSAVNALASAQLQAFLTGVQASIAAGNVTPSGGDLWTPVDDSQSASWDPGTTSGGGTWTPVDDSQTAVWS